jgi:hypothetical protein
LVISEQTKKQLLPEDGMSLNRNLLLDKEICIMTTTNCETGINKNNNDNTELTEYVTSVVNTCNGFEGGVFQKLVQHVLRNGGMEKSKQQLTEGENIIMSLQKAKCMSSGVMIRHNIHEVNNIHVSTMIRNNRDMIETKEKSASKKKRNEILKRINTIKLLRLTNPCINGWNIKECKEFIQYKKQKGDPKMPITLPILRQRCIIVQGRMSPDCSVHESDIDNGDNDDVLEAANGTSSESV